MGGHHGGVRCPCDATHCGGASDAPHDTPLLFFDNLVKKLDKLTIKNFTSYHPPHHPQTLQHPTQHPHPQPCHHPPHQPPTPPTPTHLTRHPYHHCPPTPPDTHSTTTHLPTPPDTHPTTTQPPQEPTPPTHGAKMVQECLIFHGLLHIVYPFGRQLCFILTG